MTGYIWLCEECHGRGIIMLQQDVRTKIIGKMMWPPDSPQTVWEYRGTRPYTVKCGECYGRGWWEP